MFSSLMKSSDEQISRANASCNICGNYFGHHQSDELALHLFKDHDAVECCRFCYTQYTSVEALSAHVEKDHVAVGLFYCIKCPRDFKTEQEAVTHFNNIHLAYIRKLQCTKCKELTADKEVIFRSVKIVEYHRRYFHTTARDAARKIAKRNSLASKANQATSQPNDNIVLRVQGLRQADKIAAAATPLDHLLPPTPEPPRLSEDGSAAVSTSDNGLNRPKDRASHSHTSEAAHPNIFDSIMSSRTGSATIAPGEPRHRSSFNSQTTGGDLNGAVVRRRPLIPDDGPSAVPHITGSRNGCLNQVCSPTASHGDYFPRPAKVSKTVSPDSSRIRESVPVSSGSTPAQYPSQHPPSDTMMPPPAKVAAFLSPSHTPLSAVANRIASPTSEQDFFAEFRPSSPTPSVCSTRTTMFEPLTQPPDDVADQTLTDLGLSSNKNTRKESVDAGDTDEGDLTELPVPPKQPPVCIDLESTDDEKLGKESPGTDANISQLKSTESVAPKFKAIRKGRVCSPKCVEREREGNTAAEDSVRLPPVSDAQVESSNSRTSPTTSRYLENLRASVAKGASATLGSPSGWSSESGNEIPAEPERRKHKNKKDLKRREAGHVEKRSKHSTSRDQNQNVVSSSDLQHVSAGAKNSESATISDAPGAGQDTNKSGHRGPGEANNDKRLLRSEPSLPLPVTNTKTDSQIKIISNMPSQAVQRTRSVAIVGGISVDSPNRHPLTQSSPVATSSTESSLSHNNNPVASGQIGNLDHEPCRDMHTFLQCSICLDRQSAHVMVGGGPSAEHPIVAIYHQQAAIYHQQAVELSNLRHRNGNMQNMFQTMSAQHEAMGTQLQYARRLFEEEQDNHRGH